MSRRDALRAFKEPVELALSVQRRTKLWLQPLFLVKATQQILAESPPEVTSALLGILGKTTKGIKLPRNLSAAVVDHLSEFSQLYTHGRNRSSLYTYGMLRGMDGRWSILRKKLLGAGAETEAVDQLDRFMATRLNHLIAASGGDEARIQKALLPVLGRNATKGAAKYAAKFVELVDHFSARELAARRLENVPEIPFSELGPFGKLSRILPADDPAWMELGAWAAARKADRKELLAYELQGALGEMVAARMPGVMEFLKTSTAKVLAEDPSLTAKGWRVVFQPRSVTMALKDSGFESGGMFPVKGLGGSGQSFDLSVWLVKEEAETGVHTAMPVARVQVKAGNEETALKGVGQSLVSDERRMFSDRVTLDLGAPGNSKPKSFLLRPPDTFNVVRVLVASDVKNPAAFIAKMPTGSDLTLFPMPFSGKDFGAIGNGLADALSR